MIKIKKLENKNKKKLFFFLKKNWKKNYILCKNKKLFDWQFFNNLNYNFYVAFNKNKNVVGCLGFINDAHFDKTIKKHNDRFWIVNWLSNSNYSFLGIELLNFFIKQQKPYFVGTIGCNFHAKNIYSKLGFVVGEMKCGFLTNYTSRPKIMSHKKFPLKKMIVNKKISLVRVFDINNISNFITNKSKNFIKNRYLNHPLYDYQIYEVLLDNHYKGYVVARKVEHKSSFALKIVDFDLGKISLLKDCLAILLKDDIYEYCIVYYHFTQNFKNKSLKLMKLNKSVIIPHYFNPFLKENIKLNFAYKYLNKKKNETLFVLGDCDQDRP
jgi:hypothetical protein